MFRLRFGKKTRLFMLCGGVAACHRYGVYTVGCVECMVWQRVMGMVCILLAVLSAWCGSVS